MVQGVKVERATVRTTLTPWAATARLCLGRRWSGWEPHDARHAPAGTRERRPVPSRSLSAPAGGIVVKPRAWFSSHAHGPIHCGRASAAAAPSGPKAGARAQPEPGSAPGGAERSRVP